MRYHLFGVNIVWMKVIYVNRLGLYRLKGNVLKYLALHV